MTNAMSKSSPLRRSQMLSSPKRGYISSFLLDNRNTESNHRDALAAAQAEHERVRKLALQVFDLHNLEQKHAQIMEKTRREKQRLRAEAAAAAEAKRVQELKAKSIPKPAPEPAKAVVKSVEAKKLAPAPSGANKAQTTPQKQLKRQSPGEEPSSSSPPRHLKRRSPDGEPSSSSPPRRFKRQSPGAEPPSSPSLPRQQQPNGLPTNGNPFGRVIKKPHEHQRSEGLSPKKPKLATPNGASAAKRRFSAPLAQSAEQGFTTLEPLADRYIQIHQSLKQLRANVINLSKIPGSPLKEKVGSLRREIRVSIGQLTGTKGANSAITTKLMALLRQSLDGQIPSPMVDASRFVATPRPPAGINVPNNGPTLPSLFIYLINIIAKNIIRQFINECKVDPKAADPIGVFTAQIFSLPEFSWRGQSLVDVVIAKFRVVCPVLFGLRGNEKLDAGKKALGWQKDGPSWITEEKHGDRMAGLGAGFAAIALRDFSRSSKTNPYPPKNYWKAMMSILCCPPSQVSDTQMTVLRAMIEGYERRLVNFFGNSAVAALRVAVVEFPKRSSANSPAVGSLRTLCDILRKEKGLAVG
ncbi:hypothetical protein E4U55_007750 [Claviceps digitariae]|nr:hypothetical protein E4U55_007750 [Claviceps digitariae]